MLLAQGERIQQTDAEFNTSNATRGASDIISRCRLQSVRPSHFLVTDATPRWPIKGHSLVVEFYFTVHNQSAPTKLTTVAVTARGENCYSLANSVRAI